RRRADPGRRRPDRWTDRACRRFVFGRKRSLRDCLPRRTAPPDLRIGRAWINSVLSGYQLLRTDASSQSTEIQTSCHGLFFGIFARRAWAASASAANTRQFVSLAHVWRKARASGVATSSRISTARRARRLSPLGMAFLGLSNTRSVGRRLSRAKRPTRA